MNRLVGQRPRARDNPNRSLFVNGSRHDADLAFSWRDDSRTVRPDQPRAAVLQELPRFHHIEGRNAFRDAHNQVDLRVGRFHDGIGRKRRWNEDYGSFAPVLSTASCTVLKIGQPSCVVPPLPGVTPPTILVPYAALAFA